MWALLLAFLPSSGTITPQHVDTIELNHFINTENGKEAFSQYLYRDFDGYEFVITDWRLAKGQTIDKNGQYYMMTFMDGQRLKCVRSESFVETWTDYDPELAEREKLPKEKRKLLR